MYSNSIVKIVLAFLGFVASLGAPAQPIKKSATHCFSAETIQFSCQIGRKTVSLCTLNEKKTITSLTYRYGSIGKVENEFSARLNNNNRFYGTASPANPHEFVKQVWFDRGGSRYLLTECLGGGCAQSGRLAVLRGKRILINRPCAATEAQRFDSFSRDLVSFNTSTGGGWSATELLIVGLDDNSLEKLFPLPPGITW